MNKEDDGWSQLVKTNSLHIYRVSQMDSYCHLWTDWHQDHPKELRGGGDSRHVGMSVWGAVTGNDSAAARVITHSQANVWQMVTQMALAHTIPSSRDWSPSPMIHPSHVCHVCHHTCPQSPCVAWTTTPASHVRPRLASHPTLPHVEAPWPQLTPVTRILCHMSRSNRKTGSYCDSGWLRRVSFLDKVHNLARITIFTRHWDINNE